MTGFQLNSCFLMSRSRYGDCMHSLPMAHLPKYLTASSEIPSYFFKQSKAHSRPSSLQSERQRVVFLHVLECAQRFNSSPQLLRRQRRTARLSSFTSRDSRTRCHQPPLHGFIHLQPCFFHLPEASVG